MKGSPQIISAAIKNRLRILTSVEGLRFINKRDRLRELIGLADTAFVYRQRELIIEIADEMVKSGDSAAFSIGLYYRGLSSLGQPNETAQTCLEYAESHCPAYWQLRANLFLGSECFFKGKPDEALRLYRKTFLMSKQNEPVVALEAIRNIAASRGMCGDHQSALGLLENNFNLAWKLRDIDRLRWCTYTNSYAEELRVAGEKRKAYTVALEMKKFPAFSNHPQFIETLEDCHRDLPRSERGPIDTTNVKQIATHHRFQQPQTENYDKKFARLGRKIYENKGLLTCGDLDDLITLADERISRSKTNRLAW